MFTIKSLSRIKTDPIKENMFLSCLKVGKFKKIVGKLPNPSTMYFFLQNCCSFKKNSELGGWEGSRLAVP